MRTLKRDLKMRLAEARREDKKNLTEELARLREQDFFMQWYHVRIQLVERDMKKGTTTMHEYEVPGKVDHINMRTHEPGVLVMIRLSTPITFINGYPEGWPENPQPNDIEDTNKYSGHHTVLPWEVKP